MRATGSSGNQVTDVNALAIDVHDVVYAADDGCNYIYALTPDGKLTLFAGNGTAGFSGDGGPATQAALNIPQGVAVDRYGNVYIADYGNFRVRKIGTDGNIVTIAGNGTQSCSGDGGPAIAATFESPYGLTFDNTDNLYISDLGCSTILKVVQDGTITKISGQSLSSGFQGEGGPAINARLAGPAGIVFHSDMLYVSDMFNNRIRVIDMEKIFRNGFEP